MKNYCYNFRQSVLIAKFTVLSRLLNLQFLAQKCIKVQSQNTQSYFHHSDCSLRFLIAHKTFELLTQLNCYRTKADAYWPDYIFVQWRTLPFCFITCLLIVYRETMVWMEIQERGGKLDQRFEQAICLCESKRVFMRNHSYENVFRLNVHFHAY